MMRNGRNGNGKNGNGQKLDRTLAHELNLQLIELIQYRQQRRYRLSALLLVSKIVIILGLFLMAYKSVKVDEKVGDLILVILTATATSLSTLVQYWFNQQSSQDDSKLVAEATSYDLGLEAEHDRKSD